MPVGKLKTSPPGGCPAKGVQVAENATCAPCLGGRTWPHVLATAVLTFRAAMLKDGASDDASTTSLANDHDGNRNMCR